MAQSTILNLSVRSTSIPADPLAGGVLTDIFRSGVIGSGTASGQADVVLSRRLTIAASGSADVDLQTDTDAFGTAVALAEVRCIVLQTAPSNGSTVTVAPGSTNGYTGLVTTGGTIVLPAGAELVMTSFGDGNKTSSGTNKVLTFTNQDGAASAVIDVLVLGASA